MRFSIVAVLALSQILSAGEVALDSIDIVSSSIDDRFERKSTEVSNTASISGESVDKAHIENIQQVLQGIPGLTTEIQGGDSVKIHIRGIENQVFMGERPGVAVVIDGVPVFERTGRVNIDLDNIESIKVIKGGASYLFGDDALSGAVIITTKRGAKYNHNYGAVEAGSFNYSKVVARTGFSDGENYSGHLQLSQRKGDGYWEDADYLTRYANGKFQYFIDDSSDIMVGAELSHREKDSHGSVTGVTQASTNPQSEDDGTGENRDYVRKFDVDLSKFFITYAKDFEDDANLMVNAYQFTDYTDYLSAPQKYDEFNNTITDNDAYTQENAYRQVQRGLKGEYRTASSDIALMAGADLRANEYKNKTTYIITSRTSKYSPINYAGDIKNDNVTDEQVYALYGEGKYALSDSLVVTANARHDTLMYDFTEHTSALKLEKDFHVQSFRVGATYAMGETTALYTNVSSGFRTPTIQQMFSGDLDIYGTPSQNNPDLKPETAYNYEIGLRGSYGLFDYDLALFQIDRKDYILSTAGQYVNADLGTVPESMYDNIGGVRNRGVELALNSDDSKQFWFNMAYTYLDAKFTKYEHYYLYLYDPNSPFAPPAASTTEYDLTGNYVPRVSHHQLNLMANYRWTPNLLATWELNARSSYYADEMNRFEIPGYGLMNLLVTYSKKVGGYAFEFFARVDNFMDKSYYNAARASGDSNQDGSFDEEDISIVVNPGRVYTAGLSVKF